MSVLYCLFPLVSNSSVFVEITICNHISHLFQDIVGRYVLEELAIEDYVGIRKQNMMAAGRICRIGPPIVRLLLFESLKDG